MSHPMPPSGTEAGRFDRRIRELKDELSGRDPVRLAENAGAAFPDPGAAFYFSIWNQPYRLTYPGYELADDSGQAAGPSLQAMALYYFATADGAPLAGQWISFSDLPDGRFYIRAFQGYTGQELARVFGDRLGDFQAAARACGGRQEGDASLGQAAFTFFALPRLPVLVVCWAGDEDFPSSYQLLFDASASHYLPTDACAVAGSMLTHQLVAAKNNPPGGE